MGDLESSDRDRYGSYIRSRDPAKYLTSRESKTGVADHVDNNTKASVIFKKIKYVDKFKFPKMNKNLFKLKHYNKNKLIRNCITWGAPALIVIVSLVFLHGQVKADPQPTESELATYLQSNDLALADGEVNGYDQIFYLYDGQTIQITDDNYDHISAVSSGPNIVWEGEVSGGSQIFEYNILTQALTQITSAGTNESPYISGNIVTWETWDGNYWQVMYYDGINTYQITNNNFSTSYASTNGTEIIYAEQLGDNSWASESYNISNQVTTTINQGDTASSGYPTFNSDGSISTNYVAH